MKDRKKPDLSKNTLLKRAIKFSEINKTIEIDN